METRPLSEMETRLLNTIGDLRSIAQLESLEKQREENTDRFKQFLDILSEVPNNVIFQVNLLYLAHELQQFHASSGDTRYKELIGSIRDKYQAAKNELLNQVLTAEIDTDAELSEVRFDAEVDAEVDAVVDAKSESKSESDGVVQVEIDAEVEEQKQDQSDGKLCEELCGEFCQKLCEELQE
jgi:hypothetical protein